MYERLCPAMHRVKSCNARNHLPVGILRCNFQKSFSPRVGLSFSWTWHIQTTYCWTYPRPLAMDPPQSWAEAAINLGVQPLQKNWVILTVGLSNARLPQSKNSPGKTPRRITQQQLCFPQHTESGFFNMLTRAGEVHDASSADND